MRDILIKLLNMNDMTFETFKPKNQTEVIAAALIDKMRNGDIKTIEYVGKIVEQPQL